MQHTYSDSFLTSAEKTAIVNHVTDLLSDVDLSSSLEFEAFGGNSFSASTQEITETWTRTDCNGVRGTYKYDEIIAGGGKIEMDDAFFIIPQLYLDAPQEKEDRILEKVYETGTLNVTASSDAVTRYNSTPDWDVVRAGDVLKLSSTYWDIKTSAEATLTLLNDYTGSTATNQSYEIFRRWRIKRVEEDLLHIIWKFQVRSI